MKIKKLTALTIALIMSCSVFTACGDEDESSEATTTTAATTTTVATEESSKPTEESVAAVDTAFDVADEDAYASEIFVDLSTLPEYCSKEVGSANLYAGDVNIAQGTWILGGDTAQMATPLTLETLTAAKAIQITYTCDRPYETIEIFGIFKVVYNDTDPAAIEKDEYLAPDWLQYVGENGRSAEEVYKQQIKSVGILTIPTADIIAAMEKEGNHTGYINQFGIGTTKLVDPAKFPNPLNAEGEVDLTYNVTITGAKLIGVDAIS